MLSRRDVVIGVISSCMTLLVAAGLRSQEPVMGSRIIDWNSIQPRETATGESRNFFNSRTATLDNLEMHVTTLNPDQVPHPAHRHGHEELIIVKEGNLEGTINGEKQVVGPGSVLFMASNDLHGLRNAGPGRATYHVITWVTPATPEDE